LGVIFWDGEHISKVGFFAGYNSIVWLSVFLQAIGGILVSFVINYANNITKNFATCISIVLSFLASVVFFDFEITLSVSMLQISSISTANQYQYLLGTSIVLFAVYLYSHNTDDVRPKPPQIMIPTPDKEGGSYFDLESVVAPARSPLRTAEAKTSSRPGTPNIERRPPKSPAVGVSKREF
jgi:UDP-sugar transporter A1/2/3